MTEPTAGTAAHDTAAIPVDWAHSGLPIVVGSGLAGLMTALDLGPEPCLLVTAGALQGECASSWAQGGLAAGVGEDDDPALHAADTVTAGAGLCDPDVVRRITAAGPAAVAQLRALGAQLDTHPDGRLRLGLEGAHSRNRIVHAAGDRTGAELVQAATAALRASPWVSVLEHTPVRRLLTTPADGRIHGIVIRDGDARRVLRSDRVVLATGGVGTLFSHTTNPSGSRGSGLALGLRAGAQARDLEMVQFHPTALDVGMDPMPLISEAVRGEGAVLVNQDGRPVVDDPLAPRDVVARAVWAALEAGDRVYLDATGALGDRFAARFPGITAACGMTGLNPARQPLPIRPAAHYHMGGLTVDEEGRTSVPGLWAVGEVASTGLHGANRLASNSLLEAVVCAEWVAESVRRRRAQGGDAIRWPGRAGAAPPAVATHDLGTAHEAPLEPSRLRTVMSDAAGVLRDHAGLTRAVATLRPAAATSDTALVALMICWSALARRESRGAHTRTDHPGELAPRHTLVHIADALADIDQSLPRDRST
ncbi:MAG TPA: L-aspartate oxidase [Dermatophilaceae bacterium]|nr:L-aspartate oxidase [Dermatophilaceae bacterium]